MRLTRMLWRFLLCMLLPPVAMAHEVEVARLTVAPTQDDVQSVRAAPAGDWSVADAIRLAQAPSWWRLQRASGTEVSSDWVLAIKEVYDGV